MYSPGGILPPDGSNGDAIACIFLFCLGYIVMPFLEGTTGFKPVMSFSTLSFCRRARLV